MKEKDWKKLIRMLPKGLTAKEASNFTGKNYSTVRLWLLKLNYRFKDGRSQAWTVKRRRSVAMIDPAKVDWSLSNVAIANHWGVSRERVRQLRNARTK